jgi:hypothetical protein
LSASRQHHFKLLAASGNVIETQTAVSV